MADIRINDLPEAANPVSTENVAIDGSATRRTTIQKLVDAGAPVASQAEAEAGENNSKRMTALTVKQSIAAEIGNTIASATAGALAATAMQRATYDPTNINASAFARENHTGTQAISTVSGLSAALDTKPTEVSANVTVTVGTGGNFPTISAALASLTQQYALFVKRGFTAQVQLSSGFTLAEQVVVNGIDLGWITITSVDAVVPVDRDGVFNDGGYMVVEDNAVPAFGGIHNAVLPRIGAMFEYASNTTATDGVGVYFGSSVEFLPGSGFKNARRGLQVIGGSRAHCYVPGLTQSDDSQGQAGQVGVEFSNCRLRAIHVAFGSQAELPRSIVPYCQADNAVYAIWNSRIDIYQSQIHHSTGTAVHARDGSTICARETNVSDSGRGYHALHNARIDARSRLAVSGNYWVGDGAKRCGDYAVLANGNSFVEAPSLQADNAGYTAFHASDNSMINANGSEARFAGSYGVFADGASSIEAAGVLASNAGLAGFYALYASTINADSSQANNCSQGYNASEASTINARNSQANACTDNGFFATRASRLNCRGSTVAGAATAVYSGEGSQVNAQSVVVSGTVTSFGFSIERGAFINAGSSTGTTNVTVNTLTAAGTIFK
jgi:hypothetical protein